MWKARGTVSPSQIVLDETHEVTLILRLGHADTVRVNERPGTTQAQGTQYF